MYVLLLTVPVSEAIVAVLEAGIDELQLLVASGISLRALSTEGLPTLTDVGFGTSS